MTVDRVFAGFSHVLLEVALALIPLAVVFFVLQAWLLKLRRRRLVVMVRGLILTFLGLALFLQGVYVGFLPAGRSLGLALGGLRHSWVIIPIGFILGFVATLAEPAVRVLNHEVERASGGHIPKQLMLYALSLGVGAAVALAMARIVFGWPLAYLIIPGYAIALLMTRHVTPDFVAIAFDSGGVATGPMTVTFVMAVGLGAAQALEGRSPLLEGFGMIALVALAPVLSVLYLGMLFARREKADRETEPAPM